MTIVSALKIMKEEDIKVANLLKDKISGQENLKTLQDFVYANRFTNEEKYQALVKKGEDLSKKYSTAAASERAGYLKEMIDNANALMALRDESEQKAKTQEEKIITNANVAYSSEVGTSKALEDMYRTTQYQPAKIDEKIAENTRKMNLAIVKVVDELIKLVKLTENSSVKAPLDYLESFGAILNVQFP